MHKYVNKRKYVYYLLWSLTNQIGSFISCVYGVIRNIRADSEGEVDCLHCSCSRSGRYEDIDGIVDKGVKQEVWDEKKTDATL